MDPPDASNPRGRLRHPGRWLGGLIALAVVLAAVAFALVVWLPWQQRLAAIEEIERIPGTYRWERHGPEWVRNRVGHPYHGLTPNRRIGPFDTVTRLVICQSRRIRPPAGLTPAFLSRLQVLTGLESLDLSYTQVTDDWMPQISQLRSLKELDLGHCRISGRGFGRLQSLRQLEELNLVYCPIRDQHLRHLETVPRLRFVNFAFCSHLTADGLDRFLQTRPDCGVYLLGLRGVQQELRRRGYTIDQRGLIDPRTPGKPPAGNVR